jgi:signal transduction histidine kinase
MEDNGVGITADRINDPKAFGLMGMRERVRFLGGSFYINGKPKLGTRIDVEIPIR